MEMALFLFYLAGVATNLIVVFVCAGLALVAIPAALWGINADGYGDDAKKRAEYFKRAFQRNIKWSVALIVVSVLIPSKSFLYIASGLAAGAEVSQTEVGQKAYDALSVQLDRLIGGAE